MRMIVSCSKGILGSDDDMSVIKLATNLRSEMEQILKNLKLPDDICFECNKRGFFRTNLP